MGHKHSYFYHKNFELINNFEMKKIKILPFFYVWAFYLSVIFVCILNRKQSDFFPFNERKFMAFSLNHRRFAGSSSLSGHYLYIWWIGIEKNHKNNDIHSFCLLRIVYLYEGECKCLVRCYVIKIIILFIDSLVNLFISNQKHTEQNRFK